MPSFEEWTANIHPAYREQVRHEALAGFTTPKSAAASPQFAQEFIYLRPDGEERWINNQSRIFYDQAGQPTAVSGVIFDITERKLAEAALRESEERYSSLFDSIDEGFCLIELIFDADEKPVDFLYLQANPAFAELTGLSNAVGKRVRELVPDLEQFWFETYGKVALTGEAVRFENQSQPLRRWFDVHASRIGAATSRRVAVMLNNITARKQVEATLHASEVRYRRLFEMAKDGNLPRTPSKWRITPKSSSATRKCNSN